jgi:hypothetical protein
VIKLGDWVMICETGDKGVVIAAMDQNERFVVQIPPTAKWLHVKQVHVGIEKVRKIKPILQMKLFF